MRRTNGSRAIQAAKTCGPSTSTSCSRLAAVDWSGLLDLVVFVSSTTDAAGTWLLRRGKAKRTVEESALVGGQLLFDDAESGNAGKVNGKRGSHPIPNAMHANINVPINVPAHHRFFGRGGQVSISCHTFVSMCARGRVLALFSTAVLASETHC
jgi:hypothetical protein